MKTRNLLLLAVACGLAILLAGGIKLFQVALDQGDDDATPQVGQPQVIGDMTATVLDVTRAADATLVQVELVGVDGVAADAGWRLLADGVPHDLVAADGCGPTDVTEPVACTLRFDAVDTLQFVEYARVGERRVWLIPQS